MIGDFCKVSNGGFCAKITKEKPMMNRTKKLKMLNFEKQEKQKNLSLLRINTDVIILFL